MRKTKKSPTSTDATPATHSSVGRQGGLSLLLVATVTALYWRVKHFSFVSFDDPQYLFVPAYIRNGLKWEGIRLAFTTPHLANYHPITTLSYLLDVELWGMTAGPMHVVNAGIHAANVVLLFLLLRRLTGHEIRSAAVSAVFAIHPLHVESVAWIAERKDVLSAFFFFLTLHTYVTWVRRRGRWRYGLMLLVYGFGLMSKSMLMTLPFLLLLIDFWPLGRTKASKISHTGVATWKSAMWSIASELPRLTIEKLPMIAMAMITGIITVAAQRQAGAMMLLDALTFPERLANAAESYLRYLGAMIMPIKLAVFYPLPPIDLRIGLAAAAIVMALCIGVVPLSTKRPQLFVGWFWYLGTLVPVIGLVQVGSQSHADRYTYLPLIGIYIAVVWTLGDWLVGCAPSLRRAVGFVAASMLVVLAALCWVQIGYWRDSETLYRHALAVEPSNAQVHYNLATLLTEQRRFPDAEEHFRKAIWLLPEMTQAWCNLALNLASEGKFVEADDVLQQAMKHVKPSADLHNAAANLSLMRGDPDSAERSADAALKLDAHSARAHFAMGRVRAAQNRLNEAADHFRAVLALGDASDAHAYLALVMIQQGNVDASIKESDAALRLQPNEPVAREVRNQAAKLMLKQGRLRDARSLLGRALELDPSDAAAHFQFGLLMQQSGDLRSAVQHYNVALELNTRSAARNNLAWLLATTADSALRDGSRAVQLTEGFPAEDRRRPEVLDTFAAAYAETGDFTRAISVAQQATQLAEQANDAKLAGEIRARLALYQQKKPYRE